MNDYITETIKLCAEINGPCWECKMRDECLMWNKDDLEVVLVNAPTITPQSRKENKG